jgi:hypothetical protein
MEQATPSRWKRAWTDREREVLRVYFGIESDSQVAQRLTRTVWGVRMEAWRVGLKRRDNYVLMPEVLRAFGVARNTLKRWMARRWLSGYRTRIAQAGHRLWAFSAASLLEFVDGYSWVYDVRKMQHGHWLTESAQAAHARDRWLTSEQIAECLHVAINTVATFARRGYGPFEQRPIRGGGRGTAFVLREADLSTVRENMVLLSRQGQRPTRAAVA